MEHWFELIGGLIGLAIAYTFARLGIAAAGRAGLLAVAVGVPVGMAFGWAVSKLLAFAREQLSDSE